MQQLSGWSSDIGRPHVGVGSPPVWRVQEAAGVRYSRKGIEVNRGLRTSNRKIYAIGDVAGSFQFAHVANYHAGIVIRSALFRLPARVNDQIVPWVTFTDPELAHIGLSETQARERHGKVSVLRWPYSENDRAQAERKTEGWSRSLPRARAGCSAPASSAHRPANCCSPGALR